jgi:hypothetical protein
MLIYGQIPSFSQDCRHNVAPLYHSPLQVSVKPRTINDVKNAVFWDIKT